jgi:hypothetical protein
VRGLFPCDLITGPATRVAEAPHAAPSAMLLLALLPASSYSPATSLATSCSLRPHLSRRIHTSGVLCARRLAKLSHPQPRSSTAALQMRSGKAARKPLSRSEIRLTWECAFAGIVCAMCLRPLSTSVVPPMLALHVGCMALMLPLGLASVSSIRQRKSRPATPCTAAARKRRSELFVIRHFATSALALYGAAVGMVAIYRHKLLLHRPHLSTSHSRVGVAAFVLWLAAYLAAQPHVWRDQLRARRFSLLTNKRWLWSDARHRQLGSAAVGMSLVALSSGMLGWQALDLRVSRACCLALGILGLSVYPLSLSSLAWPRDATLALVTRLSRATGEPKVRPKAPRSDEWAADADTDDAANISTVLYVTDTPLAPGGVTEIGTGTATEKEGGAEVFAEQDGPRG